MQTQTGKMKTEAGKLGFGMGATGNPLDNDAAMQAFKVSLTDLASSIQTK